MHDDRDDAAFLKSKYAWIDGAPKPLDIDEVVHAYVEADVARRCAERLREREFGCRAYGAMTPQVERLKRVADLLNQWADAREASVAKMLEG
jgi:hypothetical protein